MTDEAQMSVQIGGGAGATTGLLIAPLSILRTLQDTQETYNDVDVLV